MAEPRLDPRLRGLHSQKFCLRRGDPPPKSRASGDSAFVSHLNACTQGATGWDWSFRLVSVSREVAWVTDGKVRLYVDEPRQYVPATAKPGDQVALRLPRIRENLFPGRFTLNGGQGPVVIGESYTKFFLPLSFEAAPLMVEMACSKPSDQLRFSLHIVNSPADYERVDTGVIDVGAADLQGIVRLLQAFQQSHPGLLTPKGNPFATVPGPLGFPVATAAGRADLADGYGWRRVSESLARGSQSLFG